MAARLLTSLLLACGLLVWAVDIDKGEWSHARCLDAGFPPGRRRGLPAGTLAGAGGGAQNLTLGMSPCCWTAQELSSIIARVILEEWLGFHVNYGHTSDTLPAYLAVAGCQDSEDWACEELDADHPAVRWLFLSVLVQLPQTSSAFTSHHTVVTSNRALPSVPSAHQRPRGTCYARPARRVLCRAVQR